MVICLELGADLHMAQLMPLPLTVSSFSKIQIGLSFWYRLTRVPEKWPLNVRVCVCVCVRLPLSRCLFLTSGCKHDDIPLLICPSQLSRTQHRQVIPPKQEFLNKCDLSSTVNRHLLAVPRFRLNTYGRRAFSVAGPMAWKSLPDFIQRDPTSSTDCFRRLLKTYLFARY